MNEVSLKNLNERAVSIVDANSRRDVTFYVIEVALPGGQTWRVARRYNDFKDLHDRLQSMFSIGDSGLLQLPPKRLFHNHDPAFILRRRNELQEYLRSVVLNLVPPCPQPLRHFLTQNLYDFRDVYSVSMATSVTLAVDGGAALDVFGMPVFGEGGACSIPELPAKKDRGSSRFYDGAESLSTIDAAEKQPSSTFNFDTVDESFSSDRKQVADVRRFRVPRFRELHDSLGRQIREAYDRSRDVASVQVGDTVFVDDLISF